MATVFKPLDDSDFNGKTLLGSTISDGLESYIVESITYTKQGEIVLSLKTHSEAFGGDDFFKISKNKLLENRWKLCLQH